MENAFKYLDMMQKKNIVVTPYLDSHIVQKIYSSNGVEMPKAKVVEHDGIDEDIDEEI
jgi:hypothetical protein